MNTHRYEYLTAHLDIRIVSRRKRIMEGLITPNAQVQLKKGAVIGATHSPLSIPFFYEGYTGCVTHIIDLSGNLYVRMSFVQPFTEDVFHTINSGQLNQLSVCFTPHLEQQRQDVRVLFSMRIHSFHVHAANQETPLQQNSESQWDRIPDISLLRNLQG